MGGGVNKRKTKENSLYLLPRFLPQPFGSHLLAQNYNYHSDNSAGFVRIHCNHFQVLMCMEALLLGLVTSHLVSDMFFVCLLLLVVVAQLLLLVLVCSFGADWALHCLQICKKK